MKRRRILLVAFALLSIAVVVLVGWNSSEAVEPDQPQSPLNGSITVNAARVLKAVPRGLFGVNIEWMHNANGLWDPAADRLRPEVLRLAQELHMGPVRFPAGIGADFYRWRDGVGPRRDRPTRAHGSDRDQSRNVFGTDELLDFCRQAGTEPLLVTNIIRGSADEAADWIAYTKGKARLWEIGNEPYMKGHDAKDPNVHLSAEAYADRVLEFAAAMKKQNPSIRLMAVGG